MLKHSSNIFFCVSQAKEIHMNWGKHGSEEIMTELKLLSEPFLYEKNWIPFCSN